MLLSIPEVAFHMKDLTDDKVPPCVAGNEGHPRLGVVEHDAQPACGFMLVSLIQPCLCLAAVSLRNTMQGWAMFP